VANALYRYWKAGLISGEAMTAALVSATALLIELHGDAALHRHAVALAQRFALPAAYDAHYLALAERLQAPLWTTDARLAQVVRPALSWVRVPGEA
jgi:predicted nucleic acid-binding protein